MSMTIKEWQDKIQEMSWTQRLARVEALQELQAWPEYTEHHGSQLPLIYAFAHVIRRHDNPNFDPEKLGQE